MPLATIRRIKDIIPIKDCDNISLAIIDGWQTIIKNTDFRINDLCVYVERDSILPARPEFEFMKRYNYRVYTIKIRGVISQGVCFPISILPLTYVSEGQDVTELLDIKKYEVTSASFSHGNAEGKFPEYVKKTDEHHMQNMLHKIHNMTGHCFTYITEKLDGTSVTLIKLNRELIVCSRNIMVGEDSDYYKALASTGIYDKIKNCMFDNIAIQGEIIGQGIQGNKYKLDYKDIYIFNVYDINNSSYLSYPTMDVMLKFLDIKSVPIISDVELLSDDINYYNNLAIRNSLLNPSVKAEGIVVRAHDFNNGLSFKVLNTEFLIENKL